MQTNQNVNLERIFQLTKNKIRQVEENKARRPIPRWIPALASAAAALLVVFGVIMLIRNGPRITTPLETQNPVANAAIVPVPQYENDGTVNERYTVASPSKYYQGALCQYQAPVGSECRYYLLPRDALFGSGGGGEWLETDWVKPSDINGHPVLMSHFAVAETRAPDAPFPSARSAEEWYCYLNGMDAVPAEVIRLASGYTTVDNCSALRLCYAVVHEGQEPPFAGDILFRELWLIGTDEGRIVVSLGNMEFRNDPAGHERWAKNIMDSFRLPDSDPRILRLPPDPEAPILPLPRHRSEGKFDDSPYNNFPTVSRAGERYRSERDGILRYTYALPEGLSFESLQTSGGENPEWVYMEWADIRETIVLADYGQYTAKGYTVKTVETTEPVAHSSVRIHEYRETVSDFASRDLYYWYSYAGNDRVVDAAMKRYIDGRDVRMEYTTVDGCPAVRLMETYTVEGDRVVAFNGRTAYGETWIIQGPECMIIFYLGNYDYLDNPEACAQWAYGVGSSVRFSGSAEETTPPPAADAFDPTILAGKPISEIFEILGSGYESYVAEAQALHCVECEAQGLVCESRTYWFPIWELGVTMLHSEEYPLCIDITNQTNIMGLGIHGGMRRDEIRALLGIPDYSCYERWNMGIPDEFPKDGYELAPGVYLEFIYSDGDEDLIGFIYIKGRGVLPFC
ncbi:MAG: hypothetical protein FWF10_11220 [Clostridiales bacterium]|nr:hypothetical protein [Clostridiales bacterium]